MYSPSIDNLIRELKKLPSVGEHTAERFVFHWLRSGKKDVGTMLQALKDLMENVKSCETCWTFSDASPCGICNNPKRDKSTLCVVANPQDVAALEATGSFAGVYHVLRGTLEATEENSEERLKVKELLKRLAGTPTAQEIILALNPNLPGETTMMYLTEQIRAARPEIKITRLARGLPMGSDIQYADEVTLTSALRNRLQS